MGRRCLAQALSLQCRDSSRTFPLAAAFAGIYLLSSRDNRLLSAGLTRPLTIPGGDCHIGEPYRVHRSRQTGVGDVAASQDARSSTWRRLRSSAHENGQAADIPLACQIVVPPHFVGSRRHFHAYAPWLASIPVGEAGEIRRDQRGRNAWTMPGVFGTIDLPARDLLDG